MDSATTLYMLMVTEELKSPKSMWPVNAYFHWGPLVISQDMHHKPLQRMNIDLKMMRRLKKCSKH